MGNDFAAGEPAWCRCTRASERTDPAYRVQEPRRVESTRLNRARWAVDNTGMNNPLAYSAAAGSSAGSDRRMRGRVRQQGVISTLGTVLDLSATGMRVLGTAPPAEVQNVQIASERDSIVLRAELVWTKKVGFRRHVSGLRFLNLDETKTQRLCQLAAANRLVVPT